jgi:hypothetical protein
MPRGDGMNARTQSLDGWSITLAAGQDTTPTTRTTELTPGTPKSHLSFVVSRSGPLSLAPVGESS